ncbi:hypothetical protein EE612_000887 [Oryza sativa]|nr:hypothetical protein EE612_000887 [Oryza sativa]
MARSSAAAASSDPGSGGSGVTGLPSASDGKSSMLGDSTSIPPPRGENPRGEGENPPPPPAAKAAAAGSSGQSILRLFMLLRRSYSLNAGFFGPGGAGAASPPPGRAAACAARRGGGRGLRGAGEDLDHLLERRGVRLHERGRERVGRVAGGRCRQRQRRVRRRRVGGGGGHYKNVAFGKGERE